MSLLNSLNSSQQCHSTLICWSLSLPCLLFEFSIHFSGSSRRKESLFIRHGRGDSVRWVDIITSIFSEIQCREICVYIKNILRIIPSILCYMPPSVELLGPTTPRFSNQIDASDYKFRNTVNGWLQVITGFKLTVWQTCKAPIMFYYVTMLPKTSLWMTDWVNLLEVGLLILLPTGCSALSLLWFKWHYINLITMLLPTVIRLISEFMESLKHPIIKLLSPGEIEK